MGLPISPIRKLIQDGLSLREGMTLFVILSVVLVVELLKQVFPSSPQIFDGMATIAAATAPLYMLYLAQRYGPK